MGLLFGLPPVRGAFGLMAFAAANALFGFVYYDRYLKVDGEALGGHWDLLKAGFMPSFALFLVRHCGCAACEHTPTVRGI